MIRQRGFTLIEMAMVVLILGLMVGGGLFGISSITLQAKINQTNTSLDQIESALVLFAIRNGRLPCPADGSIGSTGANYGTEQTPNSGTGVSAACPVGVAKAVIPWITLGLDETYSADGWGRRIAYIPAHAGLTDTPDSLVDDSGSTTACTATSGCTECLSRTTGASGASTRLTACDPAGAGVTQGQTPSYPYGSYIPVWTSTDGAIFTELTSSQPALATCPSTGGTDGTLASTNIACAGNRAAYVLISHGPSGWYGWPKGTGIASLASSFTPPSGTAYTLKPLNSTGTANGFGFIQETAQAQGSQSNVQYFDDIVRWRSPAFIIQQCGSAACGNP